MLARQNKWCLKQFRSNGFPFIHLKGVILRSNKYLMLILFVAERADGDHRSDNLFSTFRGALACYWNMCCNCLNNILRCSEMFISWIHMWFFRFSWLIWDSHMLVCLWGRLFVCLIVCQFIGLCVCLFACLLVLLLSVFPSSLNFHRYPMVSFCFLYIPCFPVFSLVFLAPLF